MFFVGGGGGGGGGRKGSVGSALKKLGGRHEKKKGVQPQRGVRGQVPGQGVTSKKEKGNFKKRVEEQRGEGGKHMSTLLWDEKCKREWCKGGLLGKQRWRKPKKGRRKSSRGGDGGGEGGVFG